MSRLKYEITPVTAYMQNSSLLWCEHTKLAAVVDPGGDLERIRAAIDKNQVELDKILITHGHVDHAAGTAELARTYGVPIIGPHTGDQFWIDALDEQSAHLGIEGQPFKPDQWLNDGDKVSLGELEFQAIHCPGHTPGHIVFYEASNQFAVVGDVLFQGSIGRTDFPQGNHDDLIHSIRHKLFPLGDDIQFIPGHGPMSTFGAERGSNPFVADHRYG